jgi:hypothetical protein
MQCKFPLYMLILINTNLQILCNVTVGMRVLYVGLPTIHAQLVWELVHQLRRIVHKHQ